MLEVLRELLQVNLDISSGLQAKLLQSLLVALALLILRLILLRAVNRRFRQETLVLYSWRKATEYLVVILGVLLIGRIWLEDIQSLATYLGLLSAGIAIALQDLVGNLAGWGFIIWRRPFAVGDRIELGQHAGDVIDIRLFSFSLLEIAGRIDAEQSTGRVIHIPNGRVLREPVANYSQGLTHIWNEIPILITFESNWQKAKALLEQVLQDEAPRISEDGKAFDSKSTNRFVIAYDNIAPAVYTKVAGSGVLLTLRYLISPRQRRNSEQQIWEAVLRAFNQHADIDFAYETYREFRHWREGKPVLAGQSEALSRKPSEDRDGAEHD
jgi:small-conductance mechanosensitive channel